MNRSVSSVGPARFQAQLIVIVLCICNVHKKFFSPCALTYSITEGFVYMLHTIITVTVMIIFTVIVIIFLTVNA